MEVETVISKLKALACPEKVIYKKQKFGIMAPNALGIYMKDLNLLAKEIGKNSNLAENLFQVNIYEAKLLAGKIFNPKDLTISLVKKWSKEFMNWEICDTFSMGVYAKSTLAEGVIDLYAVKNNEFEKRVAFATLSSYCMANKKAGNQIFEQYFSIIEMASKDDRIYVKKAVNWALRSIGKRNIDLRQHAIQLAEQLLNSKHKSAQWIAKDALRELTSTAVRSSDYPRSIYR